VPESTGRPWAVVAIDVTVPADGRLGDLSAGAQVLVARCRAQGDCEGEARGLLVAAFLEVAMGSFATAEQVLDVAEDVVEGLGLCRDALFAVAHGCRAVVAGARGEHAEAESKFEAGVAVARAAGSQEVEALLLALRSELTASREPRRSIADARRVRELCPIASVPFWSTAERGQALATAALGQLRSAEASLAYLLEHPLPRLHRARTLLALAEVRLERGEHEGAALAFDEASSLFEAVGARHLLFRALHGHATAAPRRRARLLARAESLHAADPAYALVRGRPLVTVRTLGAGGVDVEGAPIPFTSTKSFLLVCALATSSGAMHWETLADRLWPDVELDRARASLRTALWEARRALGSEAWRLHRHSELVLFELDGVTVDLHEVRDEAAEVLGKEVGADARRAVEARLEHEVLPIARYDEWVMALERDRRALLAALRAGPTVP
jgi:tetratricopeptide (TPR) repeat protein